MFISVRCAALHRRPPVPARRAAASANAAAIPKLHGARLYRLVAPPPLPTRAVPGLCAASARLGCPLHCHGPRRPVRPRWQDLPWPLPSPSTHAGETYPGRRRPHSPAHGMLYTRRCHPHPPTCGGPYSKCRPLVPPPTASPDWGAAVPVNPRWALPRPCRCCAPGAGARKQRERRERRERKKNSLLPIDMWVPRVRRKERGKGICCSTSPQ